MKKFILSLFLLSLSQSAFAITPLSKTLSLVKQIIKQPQVRFQYMQVVTKFENKALRSPSQGFEDWEMDAEAIRDLRDIIVEDDSEEADHLNLELQRRIEQEYYADRENELESGEIRTIYRRLENQNPSRGLDQEYNYYSYDETYRSLRPSR